MDSPTINTLTNKETLTMKKAISKKMMKTLLCSTLLVTAINPMFIKAQDLADSKNLSPEQTRLYAQLANAYHSVDSIKAQAAELQEAIQADDEKIAVLGQEISELEALIEKRQQLIADQAVAIQKNGGTSNYLSVLASSTSISDFVGRMDVIRKLVSSNKDLLAQQKEDKETLESKISETKVAKQAKVDSMVSLEALKGDLEAQSALVESNYNQLVTEGQLDQAELQALEAEKQNYEADLVVSNPEVSQETSQVLDPQVTSAETTSVAPAVSSQEVLETSEIVETSQESVQEVTTTSQWQETTQEVVETTQAPVSTQEVVETTQAPQTVVEETVETTAAPVQEVVETTTAPAPSTANLGDVISNAQKYLGVPYVWGGKSPSGFDCSGFVQYVYRETYGMEIGGWTGAQQNAGTRISVAEAQPGDLYFWADGSGGTYHVALATGGGSYIHAPQPGQSVSYGSVSGYAPQFAVRLR